jgi:hypothetical protein
MRFAAKVKGRIARGERFLMIESKDVVEGRSRSPVGLSGACLTKTCPGS